MYEELMGNLRDASQYMAGTVSTLKNWVPVPTLLTEAADAIEELFGKVEQSPRWIPVTEQLPEECEGLDWHEDLMIRFTSVWCCDVKTGTLEVRNRLQGKMTGNEFLDQYTKDTDYHWSKSWWEPTHWMPIVPLPQPPKEEE